MSATDPPAGTWLHRGDRTIYASDWVSVVVSDVVMPDGTQVDHHVVRMPRPAAGTIMLADDRVLMLYRHRFITESWGWEIPAGGVDERESLADAAVREALEETGWKPTTVRPLCAYHPANGILDQTFNIFVSTDAVHQGEPTDRNEAARVEWLHVDEVRDLLRSGGIGDGLTFAAISYAFVDGALG